MCENRVIRVEVTGGWRKSHDKKLHSLYFSPDINGMMESRVRLERHIARMGAKEKRTKFWYENMNKESIILKWILKK
jgi:hypothetical protein